jgi:hypothetical protein
MSKDKFVNPAAKPEAKSRAKPVVNQDASDQAHDAKSENVQSRNQGQNQGQNQSQGTDQVLDQPERSQAQKPSHQQAGDGKTAKASSEAEAPRAQAVKSPSQISNAVGAFQILPGESAEKYYHGLASTIEELGAKSMMQIYAAEKMFQCLWWMRRYETQKRSTIIRVMAKELSGPSYSSNKDQIMGITTLLEAGLWSNSAIQKLMKDKGHTAGSLLEHAMDRQKEELIELDQSIALKAATLLQLQKSYEVLVNRSVLQERLKLQNELLKRDLFAIHVPTIKDAKLVEQDTLPKALKDASQEAHEPSDKS